MADRLSRQITATVLVGSKIRLRIVRSCCVCSQPRISTREGFVIRQELTGSLAGASSRHVRIVQRLPPGPHEQRALLPGARSRPRQGRQADAAPRGGDRVQSSRSAALVAATIGEAIRARDKHGFDTQHKPVTLQRPIAGYRGGLFPRRFLFAAFHFQPQRAARESGGVEIALGADALEVQHGAQAIGRRF